MLTNAGMNQFIPVMIGEEPAPYPRAVSVQKCFRTQDIEIIGDTTRHLTFFEMLGNFSFGDYFKEQAIPLAWELVTERPGARPRAAVGHRPPRRRRGRGHLAGLGGRPPERIQRMGDDNFWEMAKGEPGPCGPCSEIYYDKGDDFGADGGPLHGATSASSRSGTWCSCSTGASPTGRWSTCPPATSTPAPASSASCPSSRASSRCSRPTWCGPSSTPPAGPSAAPTASTPRSTAACASWPTTAGP